MTREEANARLSELSEEVKQKLEDMRTIANAHRLDVSIELSKNGIYTQHLEINGRYAHTEDNMSMWASSSYEDDWEESSWDDSGC